MNSELSFRIATVSFPLAIALTLPIRLKPHTARRGAGDRLNGYGRLLSRPSMLFQLKGA